MSSERSATGGEPPERRGSSAAERLPPGSGPEFPGGQTLWSWIGEAESEAEGETRRDFLQLTGFGIASAAVLAAAGCAIPERRALPLVDQPEELVPGVAAWYATTCGGCAAGCGLLVKVRDGRPIKVEGNPDSPLSRGGTCAVGQATVLSLYDPCRFTGPRWLGEPVSWTDLDAMVGERLREVAARGQRIALLTGPALGPTFRQLLREWRERFPGSRWVVHEALPSTGLRRAAQRIWGRPLVPHVRFDRARIVVGLDADFLGTWLSPVEFTGQYSAARRPGWAGAGSGKPAAMLRHVQIETQMTLTGSNADLRIPLRPSELPWAALALYAAVARDLGEPEPPLPAGAAWEEWPRHAALKALATELLAARGAALVVCGTNDPALQTLVLRLNQLLEAEGATLEVDDVSLQSEGGEAEVQELLAEIEGGGIGALLVLDANPVYDHALGARFGRALLKVPFVVSLADRPDETNAYAHAVAPGLHFLESWDDAEPLRGLLQLRQPAIAPLFDGRAPAESLLHWMGSEERWYDRLRERWRREVFAPEDPHGFDALWDGALERGVLARSRPAAAQAAPNADQATALPGAVPRQPALPELVTRARREANAAARTLVARPPHSLAAGEVELVLYPSVALRDGRWANNPWLQELPDPLAKMTWGNWAALAPDVAARAGIEEGEVVVLEGPGGSLELPAVVQPGLAGGTVAVALGYGRTRSGKVGDGVGKNAFPLRPLVEGLGANAATGFRLRRSGRREPLARTQQHFQTEGRPIVREVPFADQGTESTGVTGVHAAAAVRGGGEGEARADLWPEHEKPEHFWGMAIDLSACTGCSACVVACQAENNVAVVGRDEVARGREMHWIRVDRYYDGPSEAPRASHQPMMCQHCDHAPCETVCPVLATVHSSDGLNQQVYNRCIGTRYCANNCPYKVRRFNWFRYAGNDRFDYTMNGDLPRMVLNPDVGIRSRGVMEKCSLCIQRIQEGKLAAKRQGQPLADGAIRTACQQACPAGAIVFGDRKEATSALARQERDPRFYRVLEDLGTRPGVGYLARVRQTGPHAAATVEET